MTGTLTTAVRFNVEQPLISVAHLEIPSAHPHVAAILARTKREGRRFDRGCGFSIADE
jgi:hypothetical protein